MIHPIFSHTRSLYIYLSAWAIFGSAQALFLLYYGNLSGAAAIADSIIYNGIMILLGFSLWYPVVYTKRKETISGVFTHNLLTGMVLIGLWMGLSHLITGVFLADDVDYLAFSKQMIPVRVLIGSVLLMALIAMYHLFIFYRDLEAQKLKEETLKKQVKESELKALKAQLNPHFLFNSLNSIGSLTITDPDGALVMLNHLSDFLRYSLQKSNSDLISLREELMNMNRYLEIEKVRFGSRLICETELDQLSLDMKLPAMILQPIYENAIKHGLYESIEPVTIGTSCKLKNGNLVISIINNYDPEAIAPKGERVGLENVSNTLRNIYNQDQLLTITRENNHFEVSLIIPQSM
jgi:hypothetical protein